MKTRPRKLVLARTYGNEAAWSMWKLDGQQALVRINTGIGEVMDDGRKREMAGEDVWQHGRQTVGRQGAAKRVMRFKMFM
jgi:hypothetical protein